MKIPSEFLLIVRHAVHHLIVDLKTNPTLHKIMEILSAGTASSEILEGLSMKYSRASPHRFMKKHGFVFWPSKSNYYCIRGSLDIISMRENYLFWIDKYSREGSKIFYQDETGLNKNMAPNHI